MFSKFANFFIQNSKITVVLVIVSMMVGIGSYIVLPKQYNPTIVVPAFQVIVPSYGLSASEVKNLIVNPLENKIMEIEGIDEVYGVSYENFAGVMAKFEVGINKEDAKIRLNQKLAENLDKKPIGVGNPIIKTIDPDELSQITYAISYKNTNFPNQSNQNGIKPLSPEEQYIYLRQIANIIINEAKTIKNVTTMEIVGGYKKDIIVELDLDKIEARNADVMQVIDVLKKNNLSLPSGNIINGGEKIFVSVDSKISNIEKLKKILVSNIAGTPLYLEDIANFRYGRVNNSKYSIFANDGGNQNAIFLGFGKKNGTNAVFVTNDIIKKMDEIKQKLPKDINFEIIQNEGKTAQDATNMLIINLFQSIIIVFAVLALYLGYKDALNTAVSIPLSLALVFLYALLVGDNINKITLFALILVLGMLVDNSTVVVENVARHLKERIDTGKTKLQAVLEGTQEVGVGVILSTITRLLAFGAMFAVGGMMGEYMGPIPKYAIAALVISLIIAFSINPWISYLTAKDVYEQDRNKHNIKKISKYDIRHIYINFMKKFLNPRAGIKRKIFKLTFWILLFVLILAPIYSGIFKARMLPKSNQNQIYIWIDAPRGTSATKSLEILNYSNSYFLNNKKLPTDLNLVKNISATIGQAFMGDFANLFRGGLQRIGENQISIRLNLYSPSEFKDKTGLSRMSSEDYTIKIRDSYKSYMLEKFPDLKIRLLEDPPGPPVMATFMINIKGDASKKEKKLFARKVQTEVEKIGSKMGIEDIGNFSSTTYRKINIKLDNISLSNAGLTSEQVAYTLSTIYNSLDITTLSNPNSLEAISLLVSVKPEQRNNLDNIKNITFTNRDGKKIALSSIAKIDYTFVDDEIRTDKREEAITIYGEMGDNSLVYPVVKLFGVFLSDEFLGGKYRLDSWSPYKLTYTGLQDGKKYIIEWGGEWELTLDTFRDLGIAMGISLLAIYFLLVGQFASFGIAGIIMITFLLGFFGVFPGFSLLYLIQNEYFSATSMIGVIALAGIVVGNAIILIDYVNILKKNGITIEEALIKAGYVRFAPIILTSLTTVFGAATIIGDPVWSGLAWSIIWGLFVSSVLTLVVVPIFYYDSQKKSWDECMKRDNMNCR